MDVQDVQILPSVSHLTTDTVTCRLKDFMMESENGINKGVGMMGQDKTSPVSGNISYRFINHLASEFYW